VLRPPVRHSLVSWSRRLTVGEAFAGHLGAGARTGGPRATSRGSPVVKTDVQSGKKAGIAGGCRSGLLVESEDGKGLALQERRPAD